MGVDIFLREVQAVWSQVVPHVNERIIQGAEQVGLPSRARNPVRAC